MNKTPAATVTAETPLSDEDLMSLVDATGAGAVMIRRALRLAGIPHTSVPSHALYSAAYDYDAYYFSRDRVDPPDSAAYRAASDARLAALRDALARVRAGVRETPAAVDGRVWL